MSKKHGRQEGRVVNSRCGEVELAPGVSPENKKTQQVAVPVLVSREAEWNPGVLGSPTAGMEMHLSPILTDSRMQIPGCPQPSGQLLGKPDPAWCSS